MVLGLHSVRELHMTQLGATRRWQIAHLPIGGHRRSSEIIRGHQRRIAHFDPNQAQLPAAAAAAATPKHRLPSLAPNLDHLNPKLVDRRAAAAAPALARALALAAALARSRCLLELRELRLRLAAREREREERERI
jgi:hypothetical protein